jgi:hypothetical protein
VRSIGGGRKRKEKERALFLFKVEYVLYNVGGK